MSAYALGEAIRRARVAKGMSLRKLAGKVGLSPPFFSDLEHGRRSTTKLYKIAAALEVSLVDLQAIEARVDRDLRAWIEANAGLVELLRTARDRCPGWVRFGRHKVRVAPATGEGGKTP